MKKIKVNIPDGCKEATVKIEEDGKVVVTYPTSVKEKKCEFNDGDFVTDIGDGTICIYAGTNKTGGIISYVGLGGNMNYMTITKKSGWGKTQNFRPATDLEKQRLLDALAKEGYRWNPDKKELEELPRWRAEANQNYFLVTSSLEVCVECEVFDSIDNSRYNSCNYFRTEEAAERVAEQIREIFKNSKAE